MQEKLFVIEQKAIDKALKNARNRLNALGFTGNTYILGIYTDNQHNNSNIPYSVPMGRQRLSAMRIDESLGTEFTLNNIEITSTATVIVSLLSANRNMLIL